MNDEQIATVAKAFAHPTRVQILRLLATQTECRGQETFSVLGIAQSTLSEHLRTLKDAGLVQSSPHGTALMYCLGGSALDRFVEALASIPTDSMTCSHERA